MQNSLIIKRGFNKKAAAEDGPSFEQQFGILANAQVVDKFPKLDSMKLAFQLIEKDDDSNDACGATVYMVGKTVIFVPAFFKKGKIKTGDMMLIAQSQQFLPLSDPWLSWLEQKDLQEAGELVDRKYVDDHGSTSAATIREIADPILKTASLYLRGLLHLSPDMTKQAAVMNVLDTTIKTGKQATADMLDRMIGNTTFLNAALSFYSPEELSAFSKKAAEIGQDLPPAVSLIRPFEKEAKDLSQTELKALYKDGFFIKAAAQTDPPAVIRKKQLDDLFATVNKPGKMELLKEDGSFHETTVFRCFDLDALMRNAQRKIKGFSKDSPTSANDREYQVEDYFTPMEWLEVTGETGRNIVNSTMFRVDSFEPISKDNISSLGVSFASAEGTNFNDFILCPEGTAIHVGERLVRNGKDWAIDEWMGRQRYTIHVDDTGTVKKPICSAHSLIVPEGTRLVHRPEDTKVTTFVTTSTYQSFLQKYTSERYSKVRVYNNGNDYVLSGDNSENKTASLSLCDAAMHLVTNYKLEPALAKVLLKEASNGATESNPRSTYYYITKTADFGEGWVPANIAHSEFENRPPDVAKTTLPSYLENPEAMAQAIQTAAQNGVKEVFDVTVLKLLARQNQFFDEIQDDIPVFMQVLDSLCRKLFQFYWHTDKMEEKYGSIKLKALEESLRLSLDSLSELTIFFKLRTVDGSGSTGDVLGELMSGQML